MSKPRGLSTLEERAVRVAAPRGLRHPKNIPPEYAPLADRALQRIVDVMEENVHSKRARGVLAAAVEIREEICGPKVQKIELGGSLESILYASMSAPPPTPSLESGTIDVSRPDELAPADLSPELTSPE
jgi:hypothetical protein